MKQVVVDLEKVQKIEIVEDTEIKSLFVGKNTDSVNSSLHIVHNKPELTSRITIKAVLYDQSKFDFEGILQINKGAHGTDTYLKVDCLVIGEQAYARAVPSLEIFEDEVQGGHGATIGYVDKEMIHYLQTKGVTQQEAETILVEAFINS